MFLGLLNVFLFWRSIFKLFKFFLSDDFFIFLFGDRLFQEDVKWLILSCILVSFYKALAVMTQKLGLLITPVD